MTEHSPAVRLAREALEHGRATSAVIVSACALDADSIRELLGDGRVTGLLLREACPDLDPADARRCGTFDPIERRFEVPRSARGGLGIVLGPDAVLSVRFLRTALAAGIHELLIPTATGWSRHATARRLVERMASPWRRRAGAARVRLVARHPRLERALRASTRDLTAAVERLAPGPPPARSDGVTHALFAICSFEIGGAQRRLVRTVRQLLRSDSVRVTVIVRDRRENWLERDLLETGATLLEIPRDVDLLRSGLAGVPRPLVDLANALPIEVAGELVNTYHLLTELRPAVVQPWQDDMNTTAGIAAWLTHVPRILLTTVNMPPFHFTLHRDHYRGLYRALGQRPGVTLIANSRRGAEAYARWLDLSADRTHVLYPASDWDAFARRAAAPSSHLRAELAIPDDAPIVGGVLRLAWEKDPRLWIRTAHLVVQRRPDTRFLLVGSGELRRDVHAAIEAHGLARHLQVLHDRQDVPSLLRLMDVFLLTSRHEGLPNAVLEAQASGVPVVATDAGGTREALIDGCSGWIVRGRAPEPLAERILALIEEPAARRKAGEAGAAFVRERFGVERMRSELHSLYGFDAPVP